MNVQDSVDTNPSLDIKQQSIVAIAALTAKGNLALLKDALNKALDAGLTINEIKEVLAQLYAYCGFPRSLNGINTFMAVAEDRKANGKQDIEGRKASPINTSASKYETGKQTLQKLTGREEKALSGANAFVPIIDTFLKEHLFADIFSRDVLNYTQRELATIAALITIDGAAPQLQAHYAIGMNVGITEQQLKETIAIIEKNIGEKEAGNATQILAKVIKARKETAN